MLLALNEKFYFFTDGRYIAQSKEQVKNAEIFIIESGYFNMISSKGLLNNKNLNIGFEAIHMPVSNYNN